MFAWLCLAASPLACLLVLLVRASGRGGVVLFASFLLACLPVWLTGSLVRSLAPSFVCVCVFFFVLRGVIPVLDFAVGFALRFRGCVRLCACLLGTGENPSSGLDLLVVDVDQTGTFKFQHQE